ncbi:hypothetical protein NliqN6_2430 [Naganishia liquefaciens]|uniref:Uncharacterized protein n=1 Tax=Naganishia liquefaciens TaxID=104408 RepID=A0A8H3TSD8_9TREE|nr:hypothetical protein NliqN6_2430 [Naganishia liquefaciens]
MFLHKTSAEGDDSASVSFLNTSPSAPQNGRNLAASPVGSPTLSASPYKSTFSSFFRSSPASESVQEGEATPSSPSLPSVNTSAEALVHLEGCLDGIKRGSIGGEQHALTSPVTESTPVASPSTITDTTGLSIQVEKPDIDGQANVENDLARASGWIFTGLVLEIVSLASESCRGAEGTARGPVVEDREHQGNDANAGDTAVSDEDVTTIGRSKGKQKAEVPEDAVEHGHLGHRRRRFSLSFNFKGILNLDDIEERPNEDPSTCTHDHDHQTADWDTLCELLKHLVELYHQSEFQLIESAYRYPIPLDLVYAHSPHLDGPIPVITPEALASAATSPTSPPIDMPTCHGDPDCPESHTHLYNGRRAMTILCGRLKTLIEHREEIRVHGHKSVAELDALEIDLKERVVWTKACLACCLYLLARSETPSQLYLLQLQELLPTGISHIDYLVNDIMSTFAPRALSKTDSRLATQAAGSAANGHGANPDSPVKSQRPTSSGHRRTLSAKPSSIFSFASSVFSVGGRFHRPVKSATSLPQLSYEAASTNPVDPEVGSSLSTISMPNPAPMMRRSTGSSASAASILEKYHQSDSSRGARRDGNIGELRSPWSRFSSLRSFRQSPLTSNASLPGFNDTSQIVGRSDSEPSLVSVGSGLSRPQEIQSAKIKADSPPRLSDSITSEETNESQGLAIPVIRTIACTPSPRSAGLFPRTPPNESDDPAPRIRRKSRAFENKLALAPLDPALAAAEKASVLNQRNRCAVCGKEGFNFPACRKCNETFCSRECRVGYNKGGDGKKHVCGMTKGGSQFLEVPVRGLK